MISQASPCSLAPSAEIPNLPSQNNPHVGFPQSTGIFKTKLLYHRVVWYSLQKRKWWLHGYSTLSIFTGWSIWRAWPCNTRNSPWHTWPPQHTCIALVNEHTAANAHSNAHQPYLPCPLNLSLGCPQLDVLLTPQQSYTLFLFFFFFLVENVLTTFSWQ